MEGTKHKLAALAAFILLLFSFQIKASFKSEIYYAYTNNRMDLWKNVIERMEVIPDKSDELLLELVNYQYGFIGYCIGLDKKDDAKKHLDMVARNLKILEKHKYNLSVIKAYKSAFYGFRIGLHPISAPVNGLKSLDYAKRALKLDPGNYLAYVQYGNIQFYMPSVFGGSKKEALEYYLKARDILEKDPDFVSENWNYISLLLAIGQTYTHLKDHSSAKRVYEEILKFEPGFLYVKDDLYPNLLKTMEN